MELLRTHGGLWHVRNSSLSFHCDSSPGPLRAAVIGSGLSGVGATSSLVIKGLSVTLLEAGSLSLPQAESSIEREITLPPCLTGVKKPWIRSPKPRKAPQPPWTAEESQEKVREMVEAVALLPLSSPIALSLDPWVGRITRVHLVSCLRELGMRKEVDRAVELYRWMEMQQRRLKPTAHALTLILTILGRSGRSTAAAALFLEVSGQELRGNLLPAYNAVMSAHCRAGEFGKAWRLLEQMESATCQPDVVTFNTLLAACSRPHTPPHAAAKLFMKLQQAGVVPNGRTYTAMITASGRSGDWQRAAELYSDMHSGGHPPDPVARNVFLSVLGGAGKAEAAHEVLLSAISRGEFVDVAAFSIVISALGKAGDAPAALALFEEMRERGLVPDGACYSAMLGVYKEAGLVEEAEGMMKEMVDGGVIPDARSFTGLMQAYGRQGLFEQAARVFQEMLRAGVAPDTRVFNILMDAYGQEGLSVQAHHYLRRMAAHGVAPDTCSYNTLISACLKAGQPEDAQKLHKEMVLKGCIPDKVTNWLLVRSYNLAGWHYKANRLKKQLKKNKGGAVIDAEREAKGGPGGGEEEEGGGGESQRLSVARGVWRKGWEKGVAVGRSPRGGGRRGRAKRSCGG